MTESIKDFYIPNEGRFPYVEGLPIVVVGVSNELVARFTNKIAAEMFLDKAFERYGRIIETTAPSEGTAEEAERLLNAAMAKRNAEPQHGQSGYATGNGYGHG